MDKIQDYILDSEELEETAPAGAERETRKKPSVFYEVVVENGLDVVIRRSTSRSERIAAFIVSKNQYYIKDKGDVAPMTADNLNKFLASSTEPIILEKTVWLKKITKGIKESAALLHFISEHENVLSTGMFGFEYPKNLWKQDFMKQLYEADSKLAKYIFERIAGGRTCALDVYDALPGSTQGSRYLSTCLFNSYCDWAWLYFFKLIYGWDYTRKLIDVFSERELNLGCSSSDFLELMAIVSPQIDNILSNRTDAKGRKHLGIHKFTLPLGWAETESFAMKVSGLSNSSGYFDASKFIEYAASYEQEGYSSLEDMVSVWKDTLRMEKSIHGKIRDKYPKNLETTHNVLALKERKAEMLKQLCDFKAVYEENSKLEWNNKKWAVLVPKTPEEMIQEAANQSNCLAGYVKKVASGDTKIAFLRSKDALDISRITIEVTGDYVCQAKGRYNRAATTEEKLAVTEWAKEKNLVYDAKF